MIHLVNKISGGILILIFGGILVLTGLPRAFGVEPMIVKSGSMEPVISTGSLTCYCLSGGKWRGDSAPGGCN